MTKEIFFNIASMEHMTKQPVGRRYALFCMEARRGTSMFECETNSTMGHIDDFESYQEAKALGISHPHSIFIRFYPDEQNKSPSGDFIQDRDNSDLDHIIA